jgi:hypothetical protein
MADKSKSEYGIKHTKSEGILGIVSWVTSGVFFVITCYRLINIDNLFNLKLFTSTFKDYWVVLFMALSFITYLTFDNIYKKGLKRRIKELQDKEVKNEMP